MNRQLLLTIVWILSFVGALALVESYIQVKDFAGKTVLIADDRLDAMKPLVILYGGYLTGILGFWFVRPFPAPQAERQWHEHRFAIALVCTAIFNVVILYLVGQQYISGERWVIDDVGTAAIFGGLLSFVVAPINAYYFGVKRAGG
jgi:hypothetical protein